MYAIAFDLHQATLERYYKGPYSRNAYDDIARELALHGFTREQGSLFLGRDKSTPVHCVLAVQALDKRFSWFRPSVRKLRMLRVEENSDLMPALGQGELPLDRTGTD